MIRCKKVHPEIVKRMRNVIKDNHLLGLAANQIGFDLNIIIVEDTVMYNPAIIYGSQDSEALEGCYSVDGLHRVTRYDYIIVACLDEDFDPKIEKVMDRMVGNVMITKARIIQHEIDHLNGVTIDDK